MAENCSLLHQQLQWDRGCVGWELEQAVLLPLLLTLQIRGRRTWSCMPAPGHVPATLKTLPLPYKTRNSPGEG